MESTKRKRGTGIALVFAATVYLFNPNVSTVDVLPDVIGYLLLVVGLGYFSEWNEEIRDARRKFSYMIPVSAAELLSVFFLLRAGNLQEQTADFLLFPFVFGILSAAFLIPAYIHLYDGMLYLGSRQSGNSVLAKTKKGINVTEHTKRVACGFAVLKPLLAVLPELSTLSASSNYTDPDAVNWYRFAPLFRGASVICGLVCGIIFAVTTVVYWKRIGDDSEFLAGLENKYDTEVLPRLRIFDRTRVNVSLLVVSVASVFLADWFFSDYNYLPDFLFYAAALPAVLYLGASYLPHLKRLLICGGIGGAASLADWLIHSDFLNRYGYFSVKMMEEDAVNLYTVSCVIGGFSSAVLVVWMGLFLRDAMQMIRAYPGVESNYPGFDSRQRKREEEGEIRKWMVAVFVSAVLSVIAKTVYRLCIVNLTRSIDFLTVAVVCVTFLLPICLCMCLIRVRDLLGDRYRLL